MKTSEAVDAIAALLSANVGYSIDLFGLLVVTQLEDGRFALCTFRHDAESGRIVPEAERLFDSPTDAAEEFESERARRQLGYEFEREPDDDDDRD